MARKKSPPKTQTPKQNREKENPFQIEAVKPPELLLSPPSQASGLRAPWHSRGSSASFLQNPFFCKSWFESEFCYLHLKNLAWSCCAWKWGAAELGFLGSHVHPPPGRVEKKNWVSNSQHQGKRRGLDSNCPLPRHLVGTVMGCENSVHDLWGISGNRRGNSDDAGRKMREQSIHICFLSLFYLTSTSLLSVFTSLHV